MTASDDAGPLMRKLTITTGLSERENRVLTNVMFVFATPVTSYQGQQAQAERA